MNSSFIVDKVAIGYFLDNHDTTPDPSMIRYPEVLFLSSRSPT